MNNKTLEELIGKFLDSDLCYTELEFFDGKEIHVRKLHTNRDVTAGVIEWFEKVYVAGQKNGFKLGMDTGKNYIEITKSK